MSAFSALYGVYSVINGKFCVTLPIPAVDPSLSSRTIIVTGANTGLGFESCLHLARIGVGKLILGVRTLSKGQEAKSKILDASSTTIKADAIDVWQLDMDNIESIKSFARRVETLHRIDGVLANAGIMTANFEHASATIPASKQGNGEAEKMEKTIQVNVLGTFYLYLLLLPKMRASGKQTGEPCRFVIPNSALHYTAPTKELVDGLKEAEKAGADSTPILDRLNDGKKADMAGRYSLSKLLVLYAVREFACRAASASQKDRGNDGKVIINTPNPSFCQSGLAHESAHDKNFQRFEKLMARTGEEGSRVLVHGLLAGEESNGAYLSNCKVEIPARHVTSQRGKKVQKRFVDEMLVKLERLHPGIAANV